ncbi:MAG: nucleotidyltransferase domain-containing protein [Phycisphaerae bacterium]|nr:nucleotidyltransferase domain-containing protein [Phycisphaerae bacterium]
MHDPRSTQEPDEPTLSCGRDARHTHGQDARATSHTAIEEANIRAQRIILSGSFSRGTQRRDSDIDLVVIYARDGEVVYSSAAP